MIGMGVRLQHLLDFDTELIRFGKDGVSRLHFRLAAAMIEIEHRIDDCAFMGSGVPHQIAHGICGLVEKSPDFRFGGHSHRALLCFVA